MGDFYANNPEESLRFGDVIKGFQFATPQTHVPSLETRNDWTIAVSMPKYSVVMTPCCSIEKKVFALAPLVPIRPCFLANGYLAEDLTRINRKVAPEYSMPPQAWEGLPFKKKEEMIGRGPSYIFIECFIYEAHALLGQYKLDRKGGSTDVGHYMVDFKSIGRVECNLIDRDKLAPPGIKLMQLSVATRETMRNKLSHFFGRVPQEDQALLGR